MPVKRKKNENFFKKWSSEMAYVLGFFTADGCMIENKRGAHFIEFHIADRELLVKIRSLLESDNKISTRKGTGKKAHYRLQIGSKEIFKDLLLLGFTPNKSKTVKLPSIPDKYLSPFIRGLFDGDGNVYSKIRKKGYDDKFKITLLSGFTSGNKDFLKKLHQRLKEFTTISGGSLYYSGGAHRLYFSVRDSLKLYELMYQENSNLFLPRKKKVFEKYLKWIGSSVG